MACAAEVVTSSVLRRPMAPRPIAPTRVSSVWLALAPTWKTLVLMAPLVEAMFS